MSEQATILRKARALIENPAKWTQGWYAKDANDSCCYGDDPAAVCWCAIGAIQSVATARRAEEVIRALWLTVRDRDGAITLHCWNDAPERTHPEVLAAFDKAIASLEDSA